MPVTAVNENDTSDVRVFVSMTQAGAFFRVKGVTVKRRMEMNLPLNGYRLSPGAAHASTTSTAPIVIEENNALDFFTGNVDGRKMRVTPGTPKMVSVFDLITGMTGVQNPRAAYQNIMDEVVCETYNFPGSGQRPTPVCDVKGAVRIMLLLPGRAAAHFRESTAHLLIRYLGGDESLVDEIRANAATQQTLPAEHPGRAFGEAVEDMNRYRFASPNMLGKSLHEFKDSRVVYLIVFCVDGITYIKFGKSESSLLRMETHLKDYPNAVIYCMMVANDIKRIEDEYKLRMKYKGKLTDLVINKQNYTEIIKEISPEEAEAQLQSIKTEIDNSEHVRLELKRLDVETKRLETELETKKIDNEAKRTELKMKFLEYTYAKLPPETIERNMENFLKFLHD